MFGSCICANLFKSSTSTGQSVDQRESTIFIHTYQFKISVTVLKLSWKSGKFLCNMILVLVAKYWDHFLLFYGLIYRLQIHLNVQHWTNIARIPTCKILTISKIKDTLYMLKHIPKLTYCLQTHYKVILGNFSFSTSILFLWIKLITNVQDFFFMFLDPVIKLLKTSAENWSEYWISANN